MFQDINVAKSAPFALLTIYQKSLYPTKNIQSAPILANYAKFANHFLYLDHEKWKPQISQQIARNLLNSPITMANDAKSA